METSIVFTTIPANQIVYDYETKKFNYSPRYTIDTTLVERLERSIAETGMWQPIIIRQNTMEGIAGNHRFLAAINIWQKNGGRLAELSVPAAIIDCDEGTAVSIGLLENDLRENLTQFEMIRALINTSHRKPKMAEHVFHVDGRTVEQLQLWEDQLDHEAEIANRKQTLQSRLTKDWLDLINNRLSEYTALREKFLIMLRQPTSSTALSYNDLDMQISKALLEEGIEFEQDVTWNSEPTCKCLGSDIEAKQYLHLLESGNPDYQPRQDGILPNTCRYLRIIPHYIAQYTPVNAGEQTESGEAQTSKMVKTFLLDQVQWFCIAPDVKRAGSCFMNQEQDAEAAAVQELVSQGLPAVSIEASKEAKRSFRWPCPQIDGKPCNPQNCRKAANNPPGYQIVVHPGSKQEMVCVDEACGRSAKQVDPALEQRKQERQRNAEALDALRSLSVEKTLSSNEGSITIFNQALKADLEALLVPVWDTKTMFHLIRGCQLNLFKESPAMIKMSEGLRSLIQDLPDNPNPELVLDLYKEIRSELVQKDEDWLQWISCLTLIRTWRDGVHDFNDAVQETRRINSLES